MGEWVQIDGPDGAFRAYVARPAAAPKAAVVAIQEIFGVNAVMRKKADWLASEGFLTVAPDLFWRIEPGVDITDQSEAEWAKAMELMNKFVASQVGVRDVEATIQWARAQGMPKVGAIGYCLGGLLAYLTACRTDCDASVGYYGVNIPAFLGEAANIKKPLMLHIAAKDAFVKQDAQDAMQAGLGGNAKVTLHTYAGQDHAFTREGGKHYDAAAAKIADDRTIAFLKANLT
ncbi:MAG: dienelactone hydrolase family protein [Hyphomonadaceae bacterium]|nr:dienelactone hydrolase family protein [Hyphomonadaceae bacterium]